MEQKLIRLKDRLTDLSRRNRSLRMTKLYDKWSFDLTQLDGKGAEGRSLKVLTQVIHKKPVKLTLASMEDKLLMRIHSKLTKLYLNMKAIEEETGMYDLYLGYPFLTGNLRDGTFIQAPLCLYPVQLVRKKASSMVWELEVFPDAEPSLNRTLFLGLNRFHQTAFEDHMFEEVFQWTKKERLSLKKWAEWLNRHSLEVGIANEEEIKPFAVYTKETMPQDLPLTIEPFAVLGSFPQGRSSLIRDFDEMISLAKEKTLPLVEELLSHVEQGEIDGTASSEGGSERQTTPAGKEGERFYLLPTDYSQELILQEVQSKKGLVIHGPPGTGKSQVIVNLITDTLAKGKKVLVVCQKRAALDVVYQRLDQLGFSPYVALVHDEKQDRKELYQKIARLLQGNSRMIPDLESEYRNLSKQIEEREQKLEAICQGLHQKQACGFSAYELYGRAKPRKELRQTIPVADLAAQIHRDELRGLLAPIQLYGNYYQRFGRERYVLKRRKSFATLQFSDQDRFLAHLAKVISQSEELKELITRFNHPKLKPTDLWQMRSVLAEIEPLFRVKYKSVIQKLKVWLWSKFTGKGILSELLQGEKAPGSFSPQWREIEEQLCLMYEIAEKSFKLDQDVSFLEEILQEDFFLEICQGIAEGNVPVEVLQQLHQALQEDFDEIKAMDLCYEEAPELAKTLIGRLTKVKGEPEGSLGDWWVDIICQSLYHHWIEEIERKHPALRYVSTNEYEQYRRELKKFISEKRKLGSNLLKQRMIQKMQHAIQEHQRAFRELRHQVNKVRQVWPVRKLVKTFANQGLLDLLPVWLASPETVSAIFPLIHGMFDLVIFDEASQCKVENGIPAIYRGKRVVIAGDEKQLPPFDLFEVSLQEEDEEDLEPEFDSESLLVLAKRIYEERMLQYHYRSKAEELIHFSNHAFYHGGMQVAPNVTMSRSEPAIEWRKVDGRWINQCNEVEAHAVVDLLYEQLSRNPLQTVGIITFNAKQQERIVSLIEQRARDDIAFAAVYEAAMKRGLDERVFVKNIENVQGDERDVIIFSIGYAPDEYGRIRTNFGLLNRQGGENRLNVAITRAKEKIYVVSSIEPNELNVAGTKHEGPKLFRLYLEYAKAVSEGNQEQVVRILGRINPALETHRQERFDQFDSPFEEEVCQALRQRGYQVDTQIGVSGYRIDLAIVHPHEQNRYLLGIECDGAMYHSSPAARERDLYRQEFLESRGWKIHRIWSRNWWRNREGELEKIDLLVKELLSKEKIEEVVS